MDKNFGFVWGILLKSGPPKKIHMRYLGVHLLLGPAAANRQQLQRLLCGIVLGRHAWSTGYILRSQELPLRWRIKRKVAPLHGPFFQGLLYTISVVLTSYCWIRWWTMRTCRAKWVRCLLKNCCGLWPLLLPVQLCWLSWQDVPHALMLQPPTGRCWTFTGSHIWISLAQWKRLRTCG